MKKKFMLIVALAAVLFLAAPVTSQASEGTGSTESTESTEGVLGTWKQNSKGWWFEFEDGTYCQNEFATIDDEVYYFDAEGYMATGWRYLVGEWFYFGTSGVMCEGWNLIDGTWYYLEPEIGFMYDDGTYEIDGKMWLFDEDGAWISTPGWIEYEYNVYESEWYFLDANGVVQTGWVLDAGNWYYMAEDGSMYADIKLTTEDGTYLLGPSGAWTCSAGWNYAGGWYYLDANGVIVTGWQKIDGEWYYFATEDDIYHELGCMFAGGEEYVAQSDANYFFEHNGAMVDGWYNYASDYRTYGNWVYCNADGTPYDGWLQSGADWYYIVDGSMETTRWVDAADEEDVTYYVGKDGAMVKGWYLYEDSEPFYSETVWMYTDPTTGAAYTGWVLSSGKWYYISDGWMVYGGTAVTKEYPDYPDWSDYVGEDGEPTFAELDAYGAAVDAYEKALEDRMDSVYVFGDDGTLVTGGWYKYTTTNGTTWYYAEADGKAYDGWLQQGGKWYYIDHGRMLTNCYQDGYWIGADGVWVQ